MAYPEELENYYLEDTKIANENIDNRFITYDQLSVKPAISDSSAVLYIYGERKEMKCVKGESAKLFQQMHPNCMLR